ncbi:MULTISPECIES: 2,5-didehydrogluconate reductase DkgB [unclassified Vibrio]|uniref:2,5-didehydrogluconate reductase DkgB n=1 Tax=unclassified Vibrio TaxID=2614977 RepID=UPI00136171B1|nr:MULTISPECIES: 2,5-didehydrogluconate reductase DkgB [unclassified Vibrio]NAW57972.1 2,5-didehydrogluconate reductase DkgB [Vibrio sp. V36_P2S2PM302]NAX25487.1 2,5-didehydrogluconate reductase DkgB [Vibrio sp. V38_P2S17PM301]NAX28574.1 2,5-didehydrogluconate reductase DkgB [Vibrio sp. V37_P2S8PM304]
MNTIPMLGAGTFRLNEQAAFDSVLMALQAGYRHIDTAQIYGNEQQVGEAIRASGLARDQVFITTKVWTDNLAKADFIDSVRDSLAKLQTDYVDLLLIHWPLKDSGVAMAEYLGELKAAKATGLTRQIGVSNFTNAQLEQAIAIVGEGEIATNQVEVHPYLQNRDVVAWCRQHGVVVTGYMPFAYGEVLKDDTILAIADKHGASAAQVVLAWMRQQDLVTIPSSTKKANIESNLVSDTVTLNADDMAQIAVLDRGQRLANPDFAPEWD